MHDGTDVLGGRALLVVLSFAAVQVVNTRLVPYCKHHLNGSQYRKEWAKVHRPDLTAATGITARIVPGRVDRHTGKVVPMLGPGVGVLKSVSSGVYGSAALASLAAIAAASASSAAKSAISAPTALPGPTLHGTAYDLRADADDGYGYTGPNTTSSVANGLKTAVGQPKTASAAAPRIKPNPPPGPAPDPRPKLKRSTDGDIDFAATEYLRIRPNGEVVARAAQLDGDDTGASRKRPRKTAADIEATLMRYEATRDRVAESVAASLINSRGGGGTHGDAGAGNGIGSGGGALDLAVTKASRGQRAACVGVFAKS